MFFFGRGGRFFMAARIALLAVLLIAVFVFHAHGSTLRVLQFVRIALLVVVIGSVWMRRRGRL